MPSVLPETEPEINFFLAAFEAGTLPKEHWSHASHIFAAACYVHSMSEAATIAHMRDRIQAYNLAAGGRNTPTSSYHETITVFWIKFIGRALKDWEPISRADFAARSVAAFSPHRAIFVDHYDFDILASPEARATWIEPNLRPL